MQTYRQLVRKGTPLGDQTMEGLRPLFEETAFCRFFGLTIDADEDTKLAQLKHYFLERYDPDKDKHTVWTLFGDIMLYRRVRGLTGTAFW